MTNLNQLQKSAMNSNTNRYNWGEYNKQSYAVAKKIIELDKESSKKIENARKTVNSN